MGSMFRSKFLGSGIETGSAASGHPDVLRSLRVMACARLLPPIADVHLA